MRLLTVPVNCVCLWNVSGYTHKVHDVIMDPSALVYPTHVTGMVSHTERYIPGLLLRVHAANGTFFLFSTSAPLT